MADVIVTLRIMGESPDIDMKKIETATLAKIKVFSKMDNHKCEIEQVAFGLKACKIMFVMDENVGSTDKLEEEIATIPGVSGVECTDVRRALG
ncbi:MAG: elongation factor 1-beta [Candidatus Woesearchaeota archaeon]|nr:elongation factor 1-beta [Candidatus Woesearchaeota archaeon]